jgi:hypothetical protein
MRNVVYFYYLPFIGIKVTKKQRNRQNIENAYLVTDKEEICVVYTNEITIVRNDYYLNHIEKDNKFYAFYCFPESLKQVHPLLYNGQYRKLPKEAVNVIVKHHVEKEVDVEISLEVESNGVQVEKIKKSYNRYLVAIGNSVTNRKVLAEYWSKELDYPFTIDMELMTKVSECETITI